MRKAEIRAGFSGAMAFPMGNREGRTLAQQRPNQETGGEHIERPHRLVSHQPEEKELTEEASKYITHLG